LKQVEHRIPPQPAPKKRGEEIRKEKGNKQTKKQQSSFQTKQRKKRKNNNKIITLASAPDVTSRAGQSELANARGTRHRTGLAARRLGANFQRFGGAIRAFLAFTMRTGQHMSTKIDAMRTKIIAKIKKN
jgi:hypothetical protein